MAVFTMLALSFGRRSARAGRLMTNLGSHPEEVSLDRLISLSDCILIARRGLNFHGAFASRDPFDGTVFETVELLWDKRALPAAGANHGAPLTTFTIGRLRKSKDSADKNVGDPLYKDLVYPSAEDENRLFSTNETSLILFLSSDPSRDGAFRLVCFRSWDSVKNKDRILERIRRLNQRRS